MLTILLLLAGCRTGPDIDDDPLPTDTDHPIVSVGGLQFYERKPKNVLFLSIDTFRKDHLGAHGDLGLTPFLDRIASEGVVLDDHQQCSNWTFDSTTCTLAGRSHVERGHIPRLSGGDMDRLPVPGDTPMLAGWLDQAGYASVLISGNDWLGNKWGNAQGYDVVESPGGDALKVLDKGRTHIVKQLKEEDTDKFFLHLHFMEPHAAYQPPSEYVDLPDYLEPWLLGNLRSRDVHYDMRDSWPSLDQDTREQLKGHLLALYQGEIRTIDARLEDNWEILEQEGYLNDTLVVIWNDHGEGFWEHGSQTHAYMLYGEENDGFAIFWSRNIVPGRITSPTHATDIVPTVLETAGVPIPHVVSGEVVGTSSEDRVRFSSAVARRGGVNMVTKNDLKLTYRWTGQVTLFDRSVDPQETEDLYDPTDPDVLELWSLLAPQAQAMGDLLNTPEPRPEWPDELPTPEELTAD